MKIQELNLVLRGENKFKSFGLVLKRLVSSVYPPAQKSHHDLKRYGGSTLKKNKAQGTRNRGHREQGPQGTRHKAQESRNFFLII